MESDRSFESTERAVDPFGSPDRAEATTSSFGRRLAGTLRGSRRTFAEIAADRRATWHAVAIIVVTGILPFALGAAGSWVSSSEGPRWDEQALGAASALVFPLTSAVIVAFLYRIIAKRLGSRSPVHGCWFRMVGFTSAVDVLAVVPIMGWVAAAIYNLTLEVVATRELASTTVGRSLAIVLLGQVVYMFSAGVLVLLLTAVSSLIGTLVNPFQ